MCDYYEQYLVSNAQWRLQEFVEENKFGPPLR